MSKRVKIIRSSAPVPIQRHGLVVLRILKVTNSKDHWLNPGASYYLLQGIEEDGHTWSLGSRASKTEALRLAESVALKKRFPAGSTDFRL